MSARTYLSPKLVNTTMRDLLADGPEAVSFGQVATTLAKNGHLSPRTKRAFSRQAIMDVLTHPKNAVGRALVAESASRRAGAARFSGPEVEDVSTLQQPEAATRPAAQAGYTQPKERPSLRRLRSRRLPGDVRAVPARGK